MKDIQRLKKQLLKEELRRQGKTRRQTVLIVAGLVLATFVAAAGFWYRANLDEILQDRFQKGQALQDAGRYADALDQFQGLYKKHPDFVRSPEALFQTAEILNHYLANYQEALLCYLLLERDYPENAWVRGAQHQAAAIYKYRLEDYVLAISTYQKVLDQVTEDADRVQYEVADSYFRLNNFEQARIEFGSLLKNHPQSLLLPEVQFRIAVTYALEGQLPEAVGAYRLVTERWPESPYASEAQFGLAAVLEEQEELQKALEILKALQGYSNPEVLKRKIEKVRSRIAKKKKAI
ncbi:MAG: tetratricopeptide repeat protein [Desulfuromonadales bacterium]|nr:tetratricopeptide repeat protein [Desulfuromonadales bacterium]